MMHYGLFYGPIYGPIESHSLLLLLLLILLKLKPSTSCIPRHHFLPFLSFLLFLFRAQW